MHKSIGIRDSPHAAAIARGFVRDTLIEWDTCANIEDAELVASELATNAVRYGDPPLTIHLSSEGEKICIEVVDCGSVHPGHNLVPARESAPTGRGLIIVAALSHSWGVHPLKSGKGIWALLPA